MVRAVTRTVTDAVVDAATARGALAPRDGIVLESTESPGRFGASEGPVDAYERTVTVETLPGGRARVHQVVELELAVPWIGWLFAPSVRRRVRRLTESPSLPWWMPPARLDARAARTLTSLAALALVTGYLGTVLTQTVTFAGKELGAGTAAQGWVLSAARADVLVALPLVALADRKGRRALLLACSAIGALLTAAGALSPSLAWLAATQAAARGFVTAALILLFVVAVEEVAARARAWAAGVLILTGALGAGACVMMVPLAGLAPGAWRILYAAGALGVLLLLPAGRHLRESRRFGRPAALRRGRAGAGLRGRRLWLLGAASFSVAAFAVPSSQYLNQYLRTERGFSPSRIALFVLLTSTPAGVGVVAGGRLADLRGRRAVAVAALLAGSGATVAYFLSGGWSMWAWSVVASVVGAAAVPTLAVYGPELFPTSLRGSANGAIFAANRLGGAAGLLVVGGLSRELSGIGYPLAVLAAGPVLVALLVATVFPDTAGMELEALNPADAGARDETVRGPP